MKTATPDLAATKHQSLVKRDFTATVPNQLLVTDLTFVARRVGAAYVYLVVDDISRMVVG